MAKTDDVAAALIKKLQSGNYEVGDEFLGISDVQREFDAAFGTSRRALGQLADRGLIEIRQGRRNVVAKLPEPDPAVLLASLVRARDALSEAINYLGRLGPSAS